MYGGIESKRYYKIDLKLIVIKITSTCSSTIFMLKYGSQSALSCIDRDTANTIFSGSTSKRRAIAPVLKSTVPLKIVSYF